MFESGCEVTLEVFLYPMPLIHEKSLLLSECKINQNMESSDIIYLLLAILFTILGIFNESKKKRKKREEKEEKKQTMLSKPFPNDGDIPP